MFQFSKLAVAVLMLTSSAAFANSDRLDVKPLRDCGGSVELREADNGDLAIKLVNLDTSRCDRLVFTDVSSRREIKAYDIRGTSYTLSKSMIESLSDDCRVNFRISGRYRSDSFDIVTRCRRAANPSGERSYQLSNAGNCKLMINGQYSNQNVAAVFCQGAQSTRDIINYEVSNRGNCKLMINGQYSNRNVDDAFCR